MKEIKLLDEITLKVEFKMLVEDIGIEACHQVLYELVKSAELLAEVMVEHEKEAK